MLALSDRVLLKLSVASHTVRELSRLLEADVYALHRVLRGLEAQGFVQAHQVRHLGTFWSLSPGVQVALRPAQLVVTGPSTRPGACGAISTQGRPCGRPPLADGRCALHADSSTPGEALV